MWDLSLVGTATAGCDLGQASGQLGWPRFFAFLSKRICPPYSRWCQPTNMKSD